MLFPKRTWEPIRRGAITVAFRYWKRQQVLPGRRYRTPAGLIQVDDVRIIDPATVTRADAKRAGHPDRAAMLAEYPARPGAPLYRVRFRYVDEPDPRSVLAADDRLTEADIQGLSARLDRLDRASSHGAWTRQVLVTIADLPARRAPDLAAMYGRATQPFKTDVRKLKNLGLTHSLPVGYELSPRGRAFLAATGGTGIADSGRNDGP